MCRGPGWAAGGGWGWSGDYRSVCTSVRPVLLTQTARTQGSDWPWEASGEPRLLFVQLIDLLTLSTGRVSLNLISEFISGETCVQK